MSYGCEFQSGPSSCRRWSTSSLISPRLRVEGVCRRVDDRHCKPSTYWLAIGSEFVTLVVTSELLLKAMDRTAALAGIAEAQARLREAEGKLAEASYRLQGWCSDRIRDPPNTVWQGMCEG